MAPARNRCARVVIRAAGAQRCAAGTDYPFGMIGAPLRPAPRLDATFCHVVHEADRLRAAQWRAYLEECRVSVADEAEAAAWTRLQARLGAIDDQLARRIPRSR
jgi:hypothetical protein